RRSPRTAFLAGFSIVTFSIVSNFLLPIGVAMAERLMYLPSVGFVALAGLGLTGLVGRVSGSVLRRSLLLSIMTLALALPRAGRSVPHSTDWKTREALFLGDASSTKPARTLCNAGWTLIENGQPERALAFINASASITPNAEVKFLLGRAYGALGRETDRM